jgi:pimeloyl-ACP methyl ester carboxylesterase
VHVRILGAGPRIVFVHGSVVGGRGTWREQEPLAADYTLVVPDRPGFPPNPEVEHVDFEEHAGLVAELIEDGDHLVGHSYGGVIALYAAALAPPLRSLTAIEPPAFGLARGRNGIDELIEQLAAHWASAPSETRTFLSGFLALIGSSLVLGAGDLSPDLAQGARTLMVERSPVEADPPLEALAGRPFPKLVVSGGHSAAFDAVCDVLQERLGAQRAVLPGAGHSIPRLGPPLNELLRVFVARQPGGNVSDSDHV